MFKSLLFRPLLFALFALLLSGPAFADDFYEQQLRAGKTDLGAGHTVVAADELRIAAFGLLDRPPLLTEALVRLALAQNTLGQSSRMRQTLSRFLDVERKFATYASAALDAQTRTAFDALLLKEEPRAELNAIPSLAKLARSEAAKVADLPPDKREAAYEAGFRGAPGNIEWPLAAATNAASVANDQETIRWSRRALSIDNKNAIARVLLVHALARRGDCRDAVNEFNDLPASEVAARPELAADDFVCLVSLSRWNDAETMAAKLPESQKSRADVARALQSVTARHAVAKAPSTAPASSNSATPATTPGPAGKPAAAPGLGSTQVLASAKALINSGRYAEAKRVLVKAVPADPANRDLHLALLEASALSHDWRTAESQIPTVLPFKAGEEAWMFYASAALYEAGRKQEAKEYMQKARPRLTSTPFVDYYTRLILGQSPK